MSLFLKTYCRIKANEVHVNGELFCQQLENEAFLRSVYNHIGLSYPKFFKMDELSCLGFLGAEMTLMRSEIETYQDDEVAVVFSNHSSSLQTDKEYFKSAQSGIASPAQFVYTLPNIVVGEVCIKHKMYGENNFLLSSRFDAKLLLDQCEALFHDNAAKAVLIGWVEEGGEKHDGFFAFITNSGPKEVSAESLTNLYLNR
jgi:hypothetical protein